MTAEESFEKFFNSFPRYGTYLATNWKEEIIKIAENYAIEFAKFHVEAALKAASENATIDDIGSPNCDGEWMSCDIVNIDSILNSYPLDNIK